MKEIKKNSIRVLAVLFAAVSFYLLYSGFGKIISVDLPASLALSQPQAIFAIIMSLFSGALAVGLWRFKNWTKTAISLISILLIIIFAVSEIFNFSTIVFAGESITPLLVIVSTFGKSVVNLLLNCGIPLLLIISLKFVDEIFLESETQRFIVDKFIQRALVFVGSSSILVVFLIFIFTFIESSDAILNIGLGELLTGTVWRPGYIIGDQSGQFGLVPMLLGSIYSTIGAVILGVPLAILTAILLAEIAPPAVREIFRPAIELLAGIPSVIFGLFGMVVLAPLIRNFEIAGNSGFGILNASIILAIMILPTITNVTEDAIRSVPDSYRHASLAMGATRWQTIVSVVLPAARSGIIAAIILGIGRALGETMALIMVIGNSIAIPVPLDNNPLTILLATTRTLTGNIAVEINYAAGVHRSALFFTGVLLFLLLLVINRLAHFILREKQPS